MHILIAEHNRILGQAARRLLARELRVDVTLVHQGRAVIERMQGGGVDVLVLSWNLPDLDVLEVVACVRHLQRGVPIILASDHSSHDALLAAVEAGATDYLLKPYEHDLLLAKVRSALAQVKRYTTQRDWEVPHRPAET